MTLNINKYIDQRKKHKLLDVIKIKWYKFKKCVKRDMKKSDHTAYTEFLDLLIWIWEAKKKVSIFCIIVFLFLFQPTQNILKSFYYTKCLPCFLFILFWGFVILAIVALIGGFGNIWEIEKEYEKKLEKKENNINYKKGFNRINVILASLLALLCLVILGVWQYSEFMYNQNTNIYTELIKRLTIWVVGSLSFYCFLRFLQIIIVKCFCWLLKGFKSE